MTSKSLSLFGSFHRALISRANVLFLLKKTKIRIFIALDWPSSVCGWEVMALKQQRNLIPSIGYYLSNFWH